MSSVPATPPQHQTDLGMVADFKTSEGDFDPLSFLNDFDSIPVPSTYHQADFAATAAPLANAFHAFRNVSGFEDTSPSLTPFGLDDDTPPVNTPALEADDGSTITSPIWNDFSSFNLFPSCGQTDLLGSAFSKTSFADPSTVSPTDLALPLPLPQSLPSVVPTVAAPVPPKRKYNTKKRSATPADDAFEVDEAPLPKRKRQTSQATFNGTRNTAVPYVPVDAPTQTRQYHGPPSKTSKRDVPAAAAKKVAALKAQAAMMGTEAPADLIEQSIEEKRRQNTVAARRSRLRKAEHLSNLEEQVRSQQEQLLALQAEKDRLELERQTWMARAIHAGWKET